MNCKVCGARAESEFCFRHKPRKAISQGKILSCRIQTKEDRAEIDAMRNFFLSIWKERPHKSEISEDFLGKEVLSIFFHHILSKEKYDIAKFDKENIILLTLQEHESVELNMYKYEKINYIREKLLLKYGIA